MMEERVQGKPKSLYPLPCLHFTQLWALKHSRQQFSQNRYIRGSRNTKPPSHGGCTRGSKYARGFHIFILKYTFDRINFRKQKAILSVEQFAAHSGLNVRTFFTENHLWPIKHISEYISMLGRAKIVL